MKVQWSWRNRQGQKLRTAPFSQVVRESRAGFLNMMRYRLKTAAADAGIELALPKIRIATPREVRAIEREEEFFEERAADRRRPGASERSRETATFEKRSAAARKGWKTRRKNAAARKRKPKK